MSNFKNIQYKKYFLYRHVRLDKNVPFYIGIGVNNRRTTRTRYYERAYKRDSRSDWWLKIVNKAGYEVEIIYETDDELEIREKEREFISLYGRQDTRTGTLVNLTDGGDGALNVSLATRKKLSQNMIGNKRSLNYRHTDEMKKMVGDRFRGNTNWLGKKRKPESIEKAAAKMRGVKYTEARRIKVIGTHPNSKAVLCVTNGVEYKSIGECIRLLFKCNELAVTSNYRKYKHGVSKVCNNKLPSYQGFIFKFI